MITLPQDPEAERGIIAAFMHFPEQAAEIMADECVSESWFGHPSHQNMFRALVEMDAAGKPIDSITLTAHMRSAGTLDRSGGVPYIMETYALSTHGALLRQYVRELDAVALRRHIILELSAGLEFACNNESEPSELLDEIERRILEIRSRKKQRAEKEIAGFVKEALDMIQSDVEHKGEPSGICTPFDSLNRMMDGLHGEEVTMLAGAPSVGKTALAMQIVKHVAEDGTPCGVVSLEMSGRRLIKRSIMTNAQITQQKVRQGLSDVDYAKIHAASARLMRLPIRIDCTEALTIIGLRAKLRRWKRNYGVKLAMIDNLSLMRGDSKRSKDNRRLEIEEITNGLKSISKELDMHLLVLVHIGRESVKQGRRPRMQDMKESGSIEQDADNVLILHRPETEEDAQGEAILADRGHIIVAKARNGPTGLVPITFRKALTLFVEGHGDSDSQN